MATQVIKGMPRKVVVAERNNGSLIVEDALVRDHTDALADVHKGKGGHEGGDFEVDVAQADEQTAEHAHTYRNNHAEETQIVRKFTVEDKAGKQEPAMPTLPSMDRSMLPSIMTKVSPRATTRGRAIWLRIFIIFLGERKLAPQTMRKTTTRQASTINGASFIIFALRFHS